jgi:hypothetical protein
MTTKGTPMENPLMEKIADETMAGVHSEEITSEASALMASIGEGVDLETIMRELYNYSLSVAAMTATRIVPFFLSEKEIDNEIDKAVKHNETQLINEIELFLQSEGQ